MSLSISPDESQILAAVRAWLLALLPAGTEVVRGQDNRVPQPKGPGFAVLTPGRLEALSTPVTRFPDGFPQGPGSRCDQLSCRLALMLDLYGPGSGDLAQTVAGLFALGTELAPWPDPAIQPLYAEPPLQGPFLDGERQMEERWRLPLLLQITQTLTSSQDFAATLTPALIEVDSLSP